jgi:hypothetical protein
MASVTCDDAKYLTDDKRSEIDAGRFDYTQSRLSLALSQSRSQWLRDHDITALGSRASKLRRVVLAPRAS